MGLRAEGLGGFVRQGQEPLSDSIIHPDHTCSFSQQVQTPCFHSEWA